MALLEIARVEVDQEIHQAVSGALYWRSLHDELRDAGAESHMLYHTERVAENYESLKSELDTMKDTLVREYNKD